MKPARLAIDVQGGDYGAGTLIRGIAEANRSYGRAFGVHLCGDRSEILRSLEEHNSHSIAHQCDFVVEHCPESIDPDENPTRVWKTKPRSSIVRCISLQSEGTVDVSLSAGDTRVLVATSVLILGKKDGVSRPALAALLPTTGSRPFLLLDAGANLDCRGEHLVSFAELGVDYYSSYSGVKKPSVSLLNVGLEETKGTRAILEAHKVLSGSAANYAGFIEGSRVLAGDSDVVVTDGFAGNVLLKACESFYALTEKVFENSRTIFDEIREKMSILNAENYGAAPLLGVKGTVFKAHGSSSPNAIANAVLAALHTVDRD